MDATEKLQKAFEHNNNYNVSCFVDNGLYKVGKVLDGILVISVEELLNNYREYLIVTTSILCYWKL